MTGGQGLGYVLQRYSLFIVFMIGAGLVLIRSFYFKDGWITEDASAYLSLANNILNGDGFYMDNLPKTYQPAITWPVLYPSLIALFSYMLKTSVFWSSKLVNIFCFGLVLWILHKKYPGKAYFFGLLFLTSGYLRILTYSWSENVFILGMVLLAVGMGNVLQRHKKADLVMLFMGAIVLCYSRWIGVFSIGLIGLLGCYFLFYLKNWRRFLELAGGSLVLAAIMIAQLYYNYELTGYPTGTSRITNQLGASETFLMVIQSLIHELNLIVKGNGAPAFIIFIVFIVFSILFLRTGKKKGETVKLQLYDYPMEFAFLMVGIMYSAAIILMRMVYEFDNLNYRLLGPGTLLMYFALLGYVIKSRLISLRKIKLYLILVCFCSIVIEGAFYLFLSHRTEITYNKEIESIKDYYTVVPEGSYVLYSNIHIRYIRDDLRLVDPSKYTSWDAMIKDFPADKPLYMDTSTLDEDYSRIILNQMVPATFLTEEVLGKFPKDQLVRIN